MFRNDDLLTFVEFIESLEEISPCKRADLLIDKLKDCVFYDKNKFYVFDNESISYVKYINDDDMILSIFTRCISNSIDKLSKYARNRELLKSVDSSSMAIYR
jgi:hypothetical protein